MKIDPSTKCIHGNLHPFYCSGCRVPGIPLELPKKRKQPRELPLLHEVHLIKNPAFGVWPKRDFN